MPLQSFDSDMAAVQPLVDLVRLGTVNQKSLHSIGLSANIISSAAAGCVVLMVGRFEQFLKNIGNKGLDQYGLATPPVPRSALPVGVQVSILTANLQAAARKTRYGAPRTELTRIQDLDDVANKIANNEVWGDHAIDTHSNPNTQTVKDVLGVVGIPQPWVAIESSFAQSWATALAGNASLKNIPHAGNELESILTWRNTIAHTNGAPNVGFAELNNASFFFRALASSIDEVASDHVHGIINSPGSTPSAW